nr:hypothetical protein Iba_chr13cCG11640 [Ipomoea batatas]
MLITSQEIDLCKPCPCRIPELHQTFFQFISHSSVVEICAQASGMILRSHYIFLDDGYEETRSQGEDEESDEYEEANEEWKAFELLKTHVFASSIWVLCFSSTVTNSGFSCIVLEHFSRPVFLE